MLKQRICIVTASALGSNPRVVKEADALSQAGYDVHVISLRVTDTVEPLDEEILSRAKWRSTRLDLRAPRARALPKGLQVAARAACSLTGSSAMAAHGVSPYVIPLKQAAAAVKADLYMAHYPGALLAAQHAAKHHHALYSFDAEDFHPGDLPDGPAFERERALLRKAEDHLLPGALFMTAASPGIAAAYREAYPAIEHNSSISVILNTFPLADAPKAATLKGEASPGPSLYWFSQTIGPDRGLEQVVRGITRSKTRPHLYLRGTWAAGFEEKLKGIAEQEGITDHLHQLPPAASDEMVRLASAYDAGIVSETGVTHNRRIALTNKQFTYILAGIPVLMSDVPAHVDIARNLEGATSLFRVDDPASIADAIDATLGDPLRLAEMRACAFGLGQSRFNFEHEASTLLRLVQGVRSP